MSFNIDYRSFSEATPEDFHYRQEDVLPTIESSYSNQEIVNAEEYKVQRIQERQELMEMIQNDSYNPEKIGISLTHNQAIKKIVDYLLEENKIENLNNPNNQIDIFLGALCSKRTQQITAMFLNVIGPNPLLTLHKIDSTTKKVLEGETTNGQMRFREEIFETDQSGIDYLINKGVWIKEDYSELIAEAIIEIDGIKFSQTLRDAKLGTKILKDFFEEFSNGSIDESVLKKKVMSIVLNPNCIVTSEEVKSFKPPKIPSAAMYIKSN